MELLIFLLLAMLLVVTWQVLLDIIFISKDSVCVNAKMTQGEKTLKLILHMHSRVVELSHKLLFDKGHPWHFHVIALYGSILELTSNMILLAKDGPKTAQRLRSQLYSAAYWSLL